MLCLELFCFQEARWHHAPWHRQQRSLCEQKWAACWESWIWAPTPSPSFADLAQQGAQSPSLLSWVTWRRCPKMGLGRSNLGGAQGSQQPIPASGIWYREQPCGWEGTRTGTSDLVRPPGFWPAGCIAWANGLQHLPQVKLVWGVREWSQRWS